MTVTDTSTSDKGQITYNMGKAAALGSPTFSDWPKNNFEILKTVADRNLNHAANGVGNPVDDGVYLTLNGVAGKSRHVFTVSASQTNGRDLRIGNNIQPTHPVIIKVTGSGTVNINISDYYVGSTQILMGTTRYGQMASQILWVVPDATNVTLGGAQLPGSVIVQNPIRLPRMRLRAPMVASGWRATLFTTIRTVPSSTTSRSLAMTTCRVVSPLHPSRVPRSSRFFRRFSRLGVTCPVPLPARP